MERRIREGWSGDKTLAARFQAVTEDGAEFRRERLLPRFAHFAEFDQRVAAWGSNWLDSKEGSVCWSGVLNNTRTAIIGINTAWFCQDRDDLGKLTPGRYMLEVALEKASKANPDLLIVLGHHPLSALISNGDSPDRYRVRDLLIKYRALYLHGDQHTADAERIGDMLTIQAPAAYQAADNMEWRNGLLWAEADAKNGWLMIEPKLCNNAKGEFKFSHDAGWNREICWYEGRNVIRLPLPGRAPVEEPPSKALVEEDTGIWTRIGKSELAQYKAQPPSADMMADFFDGEVPSWQLAVAPGLKPRSIAERLATNFRNAYNSAIQPRVALMLSAGSEGKSTALIHAAAALIEDPQQNWTCLYRRRMFEPLAEHWLSQLPRLPDHAWVVAIDEADNIAANIHEEVKRIAGRGDIHLLLAARDAEWQIKKIPDNSWHKFCNFTEEKLGGLDEADAEGIVEAWNYWAAKSHKAPVVDQKATVANLLRHARDAAARNEAGELLGALLLTRDGERLKTRVARLVERLESKPLFGRRRRSLRYIYALIAAMHAENQLYLSRFVLARTIDAKPEELDEALRILRRETRLVDAGGVYVLARHRVIAQAACEVLRDDPSFQLNTLYPLLARNARELYLANKPLMSSDIKRWNYSLVDRFMVKGQTWWPVAEAVAKALHDADPGNAHLLTAYSKVLRKTHQLPEAMAALMAGAGRVTDRDRVFYYDWSTVAGNLNNHRLSVWLAGRSLADGEKGEIDAERCEVSLAGLSIAFGQLFRTSRDKRFAKAQAACGQLGLLLPDMSEQSRTTLTTALAHGRPNGINPLSPNDARKAIYDGVVAGAEDIDHAEGQYFQDLIGDPDSYKYAGLLARTAGRSKQS